MRRFLRFPRERSVVYGVVVFALIALIMLVPGISANWVVLVVVMAVLVPVVGAFVPDASHSAGKLADGLQPSSPTGFFESLPEGLPATPHVLLPPGNRIQVTKEENHLDHVTSLLLGQDSREVLAELTAVSRRTSRSERTIVEVRVEGAVVGELTATSGAHLLPLVEACRDRGLPLFCRASIRGNSLRADVSLNTAKLSDLTDDWLGEHVYSKELPVDPNTFFARPEGEDV